MTIYLDSDTLARLRAAAKDAGICVSTLAKLMIKNALDKGFEVYKENV